ncbi:DUF4365 domain-containing protein [Kitasatospora sp. NPDC086801]|uniref:DUF4365 domain-containing protein n=1 Tax=Kitasatospora sp. NPDC086801 TaxID=3364066 RepID=UPI003801F30F
MATLRPSHRIERAGVNAVRTLLEDYEHIVQEIDGGNDHGEDLIVDLTRGGVNEQAATSRSKSRAEKYKRARGYAIPIDDHYEDWKQSRIPVLGFAYDPDAGDIFWTNLTRKLRETSKAPSSIQISADSKLSSDSMRGFTAEIEAYVDSAGMRMRGRTQEEGFNGAVRARKGLEGPGSRNSPESPF